LRAQAAKQLHGHPIYAATSLRLPLQANSHVMDLDFRFLTESLIIEVEKRPAPYNKATPEYSDKICKEILWIKVLETVVPD